MDSVLTKEELVKKGIADGGLAYTGPYGIQIGITGSCNFQCVFCGRFSSMNGDKREDIRNVYQIEKEKFLSLADMAAALDVEQISIVGISEPFMHKEILLFISWIKERSMRCMVTTNGSLLRIEANCRFGPRYPEYFGKCSHGADIREAAR